MTKKKLEIHSENILPIIKKWLYSDKDIFVRELVSNACDAIYKVKLLRAHTENEEFRIDIRIDAEQKTIKFIDTGIGMDEEEIVKYIAQIAFSGAEDFVSKYEGSQEKDQFIGHFGLGFYSAYMVADKVEINTLSYKADAKPAAWICDGSSEYQLEEGTRETRGTEITLHIGADGEEFLEEHRLKEILSKYCAFLPYPIYLGEERINGTEPLWIKAPSACTDKDYLEFYRKLYPMEEEPLFWMHLNVDYPFNLKGILYFPKIRRDFDMNKNTINLYCNRVFVADNCKDVVPNYLSVLKGVIDSPDIPLNVSRSYLQMDRTVKQLAGHISKKVSDSLTNLNRSDRDRFLKCWEDISMVVKLGVLEDEKFYEKVKECLIWKTTDGVWTTVEEYLERCSTDKIIYTKDEHSSMIPMFKEKGLEVLCATAPIDPYVMQFIERKLSGKTFQRVDAAMHDHLLDKSREKTVLDAGGKTEAAHLADFIRSNLNTEQCEVEARSLASDDMPGFIIIDEHQRRMRDYMLQMDPQAGKAFMGKHTFVINTNNPLMSAALKLSQKNPELSQDIVKQVYELSLLSQREIEPSQLNDFITRSNRVLQGLAEIASD